MRRLNVQLPDGSTATLTVDKMSCAGMHFPGMDRLKGHKKTTRASDIEFDESIQKWIAVIRPEFRANGMDYTFSHTDRGECVKWERGILNESIRNQSGRPSGKYQDAV